MSSIDIGLLGVTLLAIVALFVTLLSHHCVRHKVKTQPCRRPGNLPAISILKPLKGIDDRLLSNLESFARQDHPNFEIVVGVVDPSDPALAAANELRRRHPHVRIVVVEHGLPIGHNPKVNNLVNLAARASHDMLLISDSNVEVDPDYLRTIAAEFDDPSVGLVSNVIAGVDENSPGAIMENLHLNSFVAGSVCGADVLADHACVVGKSMLFRRADLDRLGGWWSVRNILAEDYTLGRRFFRAGFKVVLSGHVIRTVNSSWSVAQFISRHLRWCQIRRRIAPGSYALEPLLNPAPFALAASAVAMATERNVLLPDWLIGTVAAFVVCSKMAADLSISRRLRVARPRLREAWLIPVKDCLILGIWAIGAFRRRVVWRSNRMWIGAGSKLLSSPPPRLTFSRAPADEIA